VPPKEAKSRQRSRHDFARGGISLTNKQVYARELRIIGLQIYKITIVLIDRGMKRTKPAQLKDRNILFDLIIAVFLALFFSIIIEIVMTTFFMI